MRVRKKLKGTSVKPRLCVLKSNSNIYVQIIDDETHQTLGSTSTLAAEFKSTEYSKKNKKSAAMLGQRIAEIALEKNIKQVVFDRGPHKYHGILAELATAARSAGLEF